MSIHAALEELARFRAHHTRASQEVFDKGISALQKNGHKKMGDEGVSCKSPKLIYVLTRSLAGWDFLEQLALAAVDIGRLDVADVRFTSDKSVWTLNTFATSGVWNNCQANFLAPPESNV